MTRILTKLAVLLGGLYATGLALWHLCRTVAFVYAAVCIPGVVEDVKERPFDGIAEMLQHGNMPWDGDTAYQPYVRYELNGRSKLDSTLPDRDNRNYTNGQQVEIILHPEHPENRHLNSAKFLWVGDLLLLGLGVILLLIARRVWLRRGKRKTSRSQEPRTPPAARQPRAAAPAPAPREPAPTPQETPRPAAPSPAPQREDLVLTPEPPPAPRRRRRKEPTAAGSAPKPKSTTTRTRKKSATATADKPKTTRRRKKSADSAR